MGHSEETLRRLHFARYVVAVPAQLLGHQLRGGQHAIMPRMAGRREFGAPKNDISKMPEIASRHDFTTFYKNRKSPWWTTRAA
jgi:hypothetical protein